MSIVAIQGGATGTGTVTVVAPSTSTNRTLTLPDVSGTVLCTASTSVVTPAMLTQPLTAGTAVASTSGTSIDFTGIPSWVKRITVVLNGVSTNGGAILVRIGPTGSIETTGYVSSSGTISDGNTGFVSNSTTGFIIRNSGAITGGASMVLINISGNLWVQSHNGSSTSLSAVVGGGNKTVASTLGALRLTTVNGTDTFNAGSVNILYEG